jgi:hypothetical protein
VIRDARLQAERLILSTYTKHALTYDNSPDSLSFLFPPVMRLYISQSGPTSEATCARKRTISCGSLSFGSLSRSIHSLGCMLKKNLPPLLFAPCFQIKRVSILFNKTTRPRLPECHQAQNTTLRSNAPYKPHTSIYPSRLQIKNESSPLDIEN